MKGRGDAHIIEPVPGIVLYKVTKFRQRLVPAFRFRFNLLSKVNQKTSSV